MLRIGNVELPFSAYLAPMAGVSDLSFRMLNRSFGCPLAYTEMISAHALAYGNPRTLRMLASDPADRPLGIQLVDADESFLVRAVEKLEGYAFDLLDFNAGCPVRKVARRGEGAALLKNPTHLEGLLRALVRTSPVPVTVKIRLGWDESSINAREVALRAEDAGVVAICVHGRTKAQGYSGPVDYDAIRVVKEAVGIPVMASGDVFSAEVATAIRELTGCDGVAVARGALGNPWIFRDFAAFHGTAGGGGRPASAEVAATMRRHFALSVNQHGEVVGRINFRKFVPNYTKGLLNAKKVRDWAFHAASAAEMLEIIDEIATFSWAPGKEATRSHTRIVSP